tara:strand:- start:1041 stop:1667 length:627 start_codon:yes stop_codon:yes gene_type:complete
MTGFVQIDKTATIKEASKKKLTKETLYKYCGFKKPDGFEKRTTWDVSVEGNRHIIELWGRDFGKAGTENKYDFPPPCDTSLYFGTCALIKVSKDDDEIKDFDGDTWLKIYEKLFGGFEDLGCEDSDESEDELENISSEYKTKNGYLKDGFVVDSTSDKSDDSNEDDSECENCVTSCDDSSDDDGSELEMEEYDYSHDDSNDEDESEDE